MTFRGALSFATVASSPLLFALGCQAIGGFEDFTEGAGPSQNTGGESGKAGTGGRASGGSGGSSGTGGSTPSGGSSGAGGNGGVGTGGRGSGGTPTCSGRDPGKHGPSMAPIKRGNGSCFWMDITEVTVADYAEFLAASPPGQDPVCAWNVPGGAGGTPGFEPNATCIAQILGGPSDGGPGLVQPITCVDWCDALAFCAWSGKDLCRDDTAFPKDPAKSDFYRACAGPSSGNIYGCESGCEPTACNGSSSGNGVIEPVGAMPSCTVLSADGTTEFFDLSGNVSEWTNACSPNTENGLCATRGGGYLSTDSALECGNPAPTARKTTQPSLGFRCCAENRADGGP